MATTPLTRPTALRVDRLAAMFNFEFAGHEVYDGLELGGEVGESPGAEEALLLAEL